MTAIVVRADSRTLPLADNTVDLVVTSPPYFGLRSYTDGGVHYAGQVGDEATPAEFVDALLAVTAECVRVLKPSGSIWVNLGDKYMSRQFGYGDTDGGSWAKVHAHTGDQRQNGQPRDGRTGGQGVSKSGRMSAETGIPRKSLMGLPWRYALRCIDDLGLILRAEVIWSKPNGLPESVTDRVRRSHEQWFHFTVEPRYFSAVDEVREGMGRAPSRGERLTGTSTTIGPADAEGGAFNRRHDWVPGPNPLGKLPGSVWVIPTQPLQVPAHLGIDHFAAFPMAWPRRIIKGWSPVGGTVLDPFGGTGTTALVADTLGRVGISCDLSHDYSRLARWRTRDPGQRASAMQVDKPPVEVDGQDDLFGGAA